VLLADGLLAAAVTVVVLVGSGQAAQNWHDRRPLDLLAYVLMVAGSGVIVLRRVRPLLVLAVTVAVCTAYLAWHYPYGPILFLMVISMYTAGARLDTRRSGIACAAGVIAVLGGELAGDIGGGQPGAGVVNFQIAWLGWLLMPWLVGILVKYTRDAAARDREEESRRRIYEERLRTAREVHDVVGHGLAVINMHAGVALHVLDRRPDQARVALQAIRTASKDSLDELRTTLAVFRRPDGAAPLRPLPGLAQLGTLVSGMRGSGLEVDLVVAGEPRGELSAAIDLAAYRIVQESLTNVLRHAGPATATVRIEYTADELRVDITDDGRGGPGTAEPGDGAASGFGIVGMHERAASVNGMLRAQPRPDGGFHVSAVFPRRGH
jgi:signal transduction histidine kinase